MEKLLPETEESTKGIPPASRYDSDTCFAILRLVLPELDKERSSYGMREKSLGDLYMQLLQVSPFILLKTNPTSAFKELSSLFYFMSTAMKKTKQLQKGQLPKGSSAAERLRKWKDPNVQARMGGKVTAAGDFCAVLANVLEGRCSEDSDLSVTDVNDLLDQLNRCEVGLRSPLSSHLRKNESLPLVTFDASTFYPKENNSQWFSPQRSYGVRV